MFQGNDWFSALWEIFREARNGSLKVDIFIFNFNSLDGFCSILKKMGMFGNFPEFECHFFFRKHSQEIKPGNIPETEKKYFYFLREQPILLRLPRGPVPRHTAA